MTGYSRKRKLNFIGATMIDFLGDEILFEGEKVGEITTTQPSLAMNFKDTVDDVHSVVSTYRDHSDIPTYDEYQQVIDESEDRSTTRETMRSDMHYAIDELMNSYTGKLIEQLTLEYRQKYYPGNFKTKQARQTLVWFCETLIKDIVADLRQHLKDEITNLD